MAPFSPPGAPLSSPVFALDDVEFRYGAQIILSHLNWRLGQGESFAILGPSGSGKTVLLKLLVGLLDASSGSVQFRGRSIEKTDDLRRRVGMTFQRGGLFDSLSCGDNLRFALRELGDRDIESRVSRALSEVGLEGRENLALNEMSGGMQKRLGIARALLLEPEVVLYDEPTAGLDPVTAEAIEDLIDDRRRKKSATIVVVTSDPAQAYRLCDRVGFLYRGSFFEQGSKAEMQHSRTPEVRQFLHGLLEGPLT